jgi:sensor histidine kinase YesM
MREGTVEQDPPRRREIIPHEALAAFVLGSPLIALTLSDRILHAAWYERFQIVTAIGGYAVVLSLVLYVVFEGPLARIAAVRRRARVRFAIYAAAALAAITAVTIGFSPVFTWMGAAYDPLRRLVQAYLIVDSYLIAVMLFKRMAGRLAAERNRVLVEREAALQARLQTLQARVQPHFLFNALNSILSLIGSDPRLAEVMVARLATLLRSSIEGSEQRYVALGVELQSVRDYLAIEQVRFGSRLVVELRVDDDVAPGTRILPMLLRPLVENAIVHGISPSIAGGRVAVAVARRGDDIIELTVDNDGERVQPSPHAGTRTSLANLEERLRIVYGDRATLVAGPRPIGGFRARITVPTTRLDGTRP